jgi:hypothetical protein
MKSRLSKSRSSRRRRHARVREKILAKIAEDVLAKEQMPVAWTEESEKIKDNLLRHIQTNAPKVFAVDEKVPTLADAIKDMKIPGVVVDAVELDETPGEPPTVRVHIRKAPTEEEATLSFKF